MTEKRRSFSTRQEAEIVRKHLGDKVPVSELADQFQVQPTLIHTRIKMALAQPDRDFETAPNCVCPAQVEVAAPPLYYRLWNGKYTASAAI